MTRAQLESELRALKLEEAHVQLLLQRRRSEPSYARFKVRPGRLTEGEIETHLGALRRAEIRLAHDLSIATS